MKERRLKLFSADSFAVTKTLPQFLMKMKRKKKYFYICTLVLGVSPIVIGVVAWSV